MKDLQIFEHILLDIYVTNAMCAIWYGSIWFQRDKKLEPV